MRLYRTLTVTALQIEPALASRLLYILRMKTVLGLLVLIYTSNSGAAPTAKAPASAPVKCGQKEDGVMAISFGVKFTDPKTLPFEARKLKDGWYLDDLEGGQIYFKSMKDAGGADKYEPCLVRDGGNPICGEDEFKKQAAKDVDDPDKARVHTRTFDYKDGSLIIKEKGSSSKTELKISGSTGDEGNGKKTSSLTIEEDVIGDSSQQKGILNLTSPTAVSGAINPLSDKDYLDGKHCEVAMADPALSYDVNDKKFETKGKPSITGDGVDPGISQ